MTLYQIWPATSGPGSATVDGGVDLATEFYVTSAGLVATGLRFWRADTSIIGSIVGRIYIVTDASSGTPLSGTDVAFTLSGTGWQTATFTAPVALTSGQRYRAVVNFPTNYSATGAYWSSGGGAADIVNGPLTAPTIGNATGGDQGSFVVSGSLAYPTNSFNATNYWIDVNVQSGQTVNIGQAVETDTAGHNTAAKTRALAQATSTDTANSVTATKAARVGQATTTQTATAAGRSKARSLGIAASTETARPVTVPAGTSPTGFPDIELVLCTYLGDLANTGTRTPADLQDQLEFIRVRRVGGNDDQITDRARIDVEVFAATRAAGEGLTETVRQRLSRRGPVTVLAAGREVVVDRTQLLAGPIEVPWPDPNVRMFTAAYQTEARRQWP